MKNLLHRFFRRRQIERDMADEMRAHLDEQTHRNLAAGMTEADARAAAMRQFGGVAQIQERAREGRSLGWVEDLIRDAGYAVRTLRQSPGFTSVIVFTLALGLGVNTALFTWFNAAAFRPLPVRQPGELVRLVRLDEHGNEKRSMTYADFVTYREHQTVLSHLAASRSLNVALLDADDVNMTTGEKVADLRLETVTPSYFGVYDVSMALGRPLIPDDETSTGARPVIVLCHAFWQNHFGGDPNVIGRTLRLRGLAEEGVTIVGVTGPGFYGTQPGGLAGWVPSLMRAGEAWRTDPKATNYSVAGRLRPGVSREQATGELQVIANEFLMTPESAPAASETVTLESASTYINLTPQMLPVLLPMVGLFGAVLLVSAANASNLILARTVTRQFEFAVRSALGASRRRLFTLLMTESLVLGVLGGVAAWGVSAGLLHFIWPWIIGMIPGAREATAGLNLHADHRVFLFTLAVAVLAGAVGGLWPALHVSRRDVASALSREGSAFGRRVRLSRVRGFLAVVQLALSSALVFTAGLLVHRALRTQFADLGFDSSRLLTLVVQAPRTYDEGQLEAARRQVLERLRSLPEVAAVSAMSRFPFGRSAATAWVSGIGAEDVRAFTILHTSVPSDYFATLQLPVVRGRSFVAREGPDEHVVMISESAARAFWPGADPVGRQLDVPGSLLAGTDASTGASAAQADSPRITVTVVGVVQDTSVYDPWNGFGLFVYLPSAPLSQAASHLLIRTSGPVDKSITALREVGRDVTGIAPAIETADAQFDAVFVQYRVVAWVAGILAALALSVAVIGLFGVMSFTVNQRVKEIGIRIALGATPGRVAAAVVHDSLRLVAAGAVGGYTLSIVITLVARQLLFGVSAFEPVACGVVILLLATLGLLACWVPAHRATQVDPVVALRAE